jgi:cobalamin biosynthesis protein CobD/CbiB
MATRRSQPFRQGPRVPGVALDAMKRGRSASGSNPQDAVRAFMSAARKRTSEASGAPAAAYAPAAPAALIRPRRA